MLILRIFAVLATITAGVSLLAYLFTRERRYLLFSFQVVKYSLLFSLLLLALLALERLIPLLL
jgi:hypothetical protein